MYNKADWPTKDGVPLEPEDVNVPLEIEEGFPPTEKDADLSELVGNETRPRDRKKLLARMFGDKFLLQYDHALHSGNNKYYDPRLDSDAWTDMWQGRLNVTYSIPQGGHCAVASFWTEIDNEYGRTIKVRHHIDLAKLMDPLISYYILESYRPISKK